MKAVVWMGASLMVLGACSDGGGDGSPDSLTGYDAEFAELALAADGLSPTDTSALPTTGSADYEGVIRIVPGPDAFAPDLMSGTLDMALNFETGSVTGEATDFVTYDNGSDEEVRMEGSLAVTGEVSRDPDVTDHLVADIDGLIRIDTGPDEDEGDFSVDGTLRGDLLGEDGQVVQGDVSGRIYNLNAPNDGPISGDFIAAR